VNTLKAISPLHSLCVQFAIPSKTVPLDYSDFPGYPAALISLASCPIS
jgi:hypothetical protein